MKIAHLIQIEEQLQNVTEKAEENREQSIKEHLQNVAEKAKMFADVFGYGDYAYTIGMAHDIGKYSDRFQEKIWNNLPISVDHSTAGAKELWKMKMQAGAFAVAGHHGGLPNGRSGESNCLVKRIQTRELERYDDYKREIELQKQELPRMGGFQFSFLIRMLFSCLVDADFLDTEEFMQRGQVERGGYDTIPELKDKLYRHVGTWLESQQNTNAINQMRTDILKQCIKAGAKEKGLYSLTVPTGAGKTVSSLAFALWHAARHHMDRVIYVIPYTSIIEQNAEVFRKILGDKNVIEHHTNALLDAKADDYLQLHQLSAENWDAPVIVTTNVQFFESLYNNKVSVCRKLHNIANSVIIFDEAQMIPMNYLQPCIRAIRELVEHYGVTAMMCTATQPSLEKWFLPLHMEEIYKKYSDAAEVFKRTNIQMLGEVTQEELSERIRKERQVLVIVNMKKEAQELYQMIAQEGSFHLSTFMTPKHRTRVLEEIRTRLRGGKTCRVVSTSLVEAGVDLSFPCVYRAEAGLDSIVQAAGRCNREGKNSAQDSIVWVFSFGKSYRMLEKNIGILRESVEKYGVFDSVEVIQYYFRQLQNLDEKYLDQKRIVESFERDRDGVKLPFADVSEIFKLIETNTKMVIIPIEEQARELEKELRERKKQGISFKTIIRKLGMYSINVYDHLYKKMWEDGTIEELADGIGILQRIDLYDAKMGLRYEEGEGGWIF